MAENLDDGEFWLPPQFLSDDDCDDTTTTKPKPSSLSLFNNGEDPLLFPYGFACSDLSSPIDSLAASSETESDDDEQLFAELTRCLSRSSLHVDSKASENHNNNNLGGSPQSTLCAFGNDSKCRKGSSSQGSPNGVCENDSSNSTLNLLHAAADEVETLRLNQQTVPQRNSSSPVTLPSKNNPADLSFFAPQSLSHYQLQIANLQRIRQQQIAGRLNTIRAGMQKQNGGAFQQRQTNGGRNVVDGRNNNNNNVAGLGLSSSAWPTLQHAQQNQIQTPQPYMRAVFLGNGYGSSTGTGVFLPRPVESRNSTKKPACATALVPARVAHALNLKLEDYIVGCQPQQHLHRFNSTSNVENVAAVAPPRHRGNNVNSQKKRSSNNTSRPQPAAVSNEIKLPQEWTY